ncbi:MAG TPA: PilZ domain-containing protein, partial [Bradyrhizobium sp.]|nr:PilZ domain-containing protein [Bradyrhizobium sp.]
MSENTIEKRAVPRQRVLKGATIAFGGAGIPCTVRNLSSKGAGLDVSTTITVPSSFTLMIQTNQFIRRCRSIW